MLSHALSLVVPGGVVVYATCSLQKEEGEEVVEHILDEMKDRVMLDSFTPDELGDFAACLSDRGWARILPFALEDKHAGTDNGNDGFFVARLRRLSTSHP